MQKITTHKNKQILKKPGPNCTILKELEKACISTHDYKLLYKLITHGKVEDKDYGLEPFFHRLGKIIDIKLEGNNDKTTEDNMSNMQRWDI